MKLLTVFTPAFNRAYILSALYESLLKQTNNNFMWLIVDDGSTDNTEKLVQMWVDEGKIEIIYYKQKNQGKHIAHNKGVEICYTPLFFCVDSDDKLTCDTVQVIEDLYNEETENNILGFYLRKGDFNGAALGENWPKHIKYTTLNGLYQKYGYRGEAAIVLKANMIKPFSFPQFSNERFVMETVFYDKIDALAPMRIDNHVCYLFEYREDGYTKQGLSLQFKNPISTGYNYLHHINYTKNLIERFKLMGQFYAWNILFSIKEPLYKKIHIPFYIKIGGYFLKTHYLKLFNRYREILNNEI